jgi:hypothetical protein
MRAMPGRFPAAAETKRYVEAQHPRDHDGKWISKGGKIRNAVIGVAEVLGWSKDGRTLKVKADRDGRQYNVPSARVVALEETGDKHHGTAGPDAPHAAPEAGGGHSTADVAAAIGHVDPTAAPTEGARPTPSDVAAAIGRTRPGRPDVAAAIGAVGTQHAPLNDAEYQQHTERVENVIGANMKAGKTTDVMFTENGDGKSWTPERKKLHDEIIDALWAKANNVPRDGKAIIAGGLGGAGKSTVLGKFAGIDGSLYLTLNPDDVKELMAKRGMIPDVDGLSPMEASPLVHEESSHITNQLARRAYAENVNVIWDITMSSRGSVEKRIKNMRDAGYGDISGVFVDIPVETSVDRALARHRRGMENHRKGKGHGGRYVPPSIIRKNADSEYSSANRRVFEGLRGQFDHWEAWDNSRHGQDPRKIASGAPAADGQATRPDTRKPPSASRPEFVLRQFANLAALKAHATATTDGRVDPADLTYLSPSGTFAVRKAGRGSYQVMASGPLLSVGHQVELTNPRDAKAYADYLDEHLSSFVDGDGVTHRFDEPGVQEALRSGTVDGRPFGEVAIDVNAEFDRSRGKTESTSWAIRSQRDQRQHAINAEVARKRSEWLAHEGYTEKVSSGYLAPGDEVAYSYLVIERSGQRKGWQADDGSWVTGRVTVQARINGPGRLMTRSGNNYDEYMDGYRYPLADATFTTDDGRTGKVPGNPTIEHGDVLVRPATSRTNELHEPVQRVMEAIQADPRIPADDQRLNSAMIRRISLVTMTPEQAHHDVDIIRAAIKTENGPTGHDDVMAALDALDEAIKGGETGPGGKLGKLREDEWPKARDLSSVELSAQMDRFGDPAATTAVNALTSLLEGRAGAEDGDTRQRVEDAWAAADGALRALIANPGDAGPSGADFAQEVSDDLASGVRDAGFRAWTPDQRALRDKLAKLSDAQLLKRNSSNRDVDAEPVIEEELARRGYDRYGAPEPGGRAGMKNPQNPSEALVGQRVALRVDKGDVNDPGTWQVGTLTRTQGGGYVLEVDAHDGGETFPVPKEGVESHEFVEPVTPDDPRIDSLDPQEMTTQELDGALFRQQARVQALWDQGKRPGGSEFDNANAKYQEMGRERDSRPDTGVVDPGGTLELPFGGEGPTKPEPSRRGQTRRGRGRTGDDHSGDQSGGGQESTFAGMSDQMLQTERSAINSRRARLVMDDVPFDDPRFDELRARDLDLSDEQRARAATRLRTVEFEPGKLAEGDSVEITGQDGKPVRGEIVAMHRTTAATVVTLRTPDDREQVVSLDNSKPVTRIAPDEPVQVEQVDGQHVQVGDRLLVDLGDHWGGGLVYRVEHKPTRHGPDVMVLGGTTAWVLGDDGRKRLVNIGEVDDQVHRLVNPVTNVEPEKPVDPPETLAEGTKLGRALAVGDRLSTGSSVATVLKVKPSPGNPDQVIARVREANGSEYEVPFGGQAVVVMAAANEVPRPADLPDGTLSARPVLYTYQRRNITALNLDDPAAGHPEMVREAAARVRHRMPLSGEHSTALADALRAQAAADGVPAPRQRALGRAAAALDAAAAHAAGVEPPAVEGRTVTDKVRPANLVEGDHVALPGLRGGTPTIGKVVGTRALMGGRMHDVTIEHLDGTQEHRLLNAGQDTYLLPDLPDPIPAPTPRPEHIHAEQVAVGDTIRIPNEGSITEYRVDRVTPAKSIDEPAVFDLVSTDGSTADRSITVWPSNDGQPNVVRVTRGSGSTDQPWDFELPREDPEETLAKYLQSGDRVKFRDLAGVDHIGTVEHVTRVTGKTPEGLATTEGWRITLRDDTRGPVTKMLDPIGDVTRLSTADDDFREALRQQQEEGNRRLKVKGVALGLSDHRARLIRNLTDSAMMGVGHSRASVLDVLDMAYAHQSGSRFTTDSVAATSLGLNPQGRHVDAITPAVKGIVDQVSAEEYQNLRASISEAKPLDGEAEHQMLKRVIDQWRDTPPHRDLSAIARSMVLAAETVQAVTEPEKAPQRKTPRPRSGDIKARMATYRRALPAAFGHSAHTVHTYERTSLADLEAGKVPNVVQQAVVRPDLAADGGPGHDAMTQLSIVKAAGADLAAELDRRLASHPLMHGTTNRADLSEKLKAELREAKMDYAVASHQLEVGKTRKFDEAAAVFGYPSYQALEDAVAQQQAAVADAKLAGDPAVLARAEGLLERLRSEKRQASSEATAAVQELQKRADEALRHRDAIHDQSYSTFKNTARARRDVALQLLSEIRPMGGRGLTYLERSGERRGKTLTENHRHVKAMRDAESVYPASWLKAMRERKTSGLYLNEQRRGYYNDHKSELMLSSGESRTLADGSPYDRVAVHELGHLAELVVPGMLSAQNAFLWSRTSTGEVGSRVREEMATVKGGETADEIGRNDEFKIGYTGKEYGGRHYEVLTTGVEALFGGSGYLDGDEDFRNWTLGALALLG